MALARAKQADSASESRPISTGKTLAVGAGIGLGLSLLRSIFKGMFRGKPTIKAVDLGELVAPYLDTGLYLAVTKDNSSVVGTGKTIREAMNQAADRGYSEPVILRAPSREAIENVQHY